MLKAITGKLVLIRSLPLQKPASSSHQRIPELDGLRGIAILLVVIFHYLNNQLVNNNTVVGKLVAKATSFGWVGVDLFFVLSGFLIGSILLRNKGSKNYFSTFYKKRLLRIVPNYYLLICIFVLLLATPYFSNNYFVTGNNVLPLWTYLTLTQNFFMASLNNMGNSAMSVTWSIAIEEQFYIVIPFFIYALGKKYLPYFLVLMVIGTCLIRYNFSHWIPPYVLLACRMDALSLGILVAWLNLEYDLKSFVKRYFNVIWVIALADIAVCAFLYYTFQDLGIIKHSLFALIFAMALIFALTHTKGWYGRLLRNRTLVWIGGISYSLYLFHYLVLGMFHHLAGHKDGIGINNFNDIVLTIGAFATSLFFAGAVFRWLETPMVNYGKRFKY